MDNIVEMVKKGKKYRIVGDNLDLKIQRAHMRGAIGNVDLHLFSTNFIRNRLDFTHLPNLTPKRDVTSIPRSIFSPSREEFEEYKQSSAVLIGRIALQHLSQFGFLQKILPKHISHQYSKVNVTS